MINIKIFAIALVASLGFTACEDDGAPEKYVQHNPLIGHWNVIQTGSLNGTTINYTDVVLPEGCTFDNLQFTETTYEAHDFENNGDGCTDLSESGTYYVEFGNIYLVDENEATSTFDVITLDDSTMQVAFTHADSGELVFLKLQKQIAE